MAEEAHQSLGVPEGTVVGERYRITRPLGTGGMSSVYLADDVKKPGRQRVVKVMASFLVRDERSRARFEQEALIGRALKHAHIVDVLAAGVDPVLKAPWIAMELLEGRTLEQTVLEEGAFHPEHVRRIFHDFGSALAAAHLAGVVHRDLKPENLFLQSVPSKSLPYTVKVLDFGIAKIRKDVTALNSQVMGSPLWMAPEQLSHGTAIGPFTDVWPYGLIAFYALVGKPYWLVANEPAMNLPKLIAELISAELVPPSKRAAELGASVAIPPAFDAWFLSCVERDHARRFPTIADATGALHRALEPVAAPVLAPAAPPQARMSEPIVLPTSSRGLFVALAAGIALIAAALLAWLFTR
jgi:serine/threonine-protein kinase